MEVIYFKIVADLCHVLSSICLKADMQYADKNVNKNEYTRYLRFNPYSAGIDFKSSESDVCGRHILTSKVDPRTVRVQIFIMNVDA